MNEAAIPKRKAERAVARLAPQTWLDAGFKALAEGGVDRIRIEALAKGLGVTKGSFYWHFRDRNELLAALLAVWREGRIAALERQAQEGGASPRAQLRHILTLYVERPNPRGQAIELAIRDWARRDAAAAAVVATVDSARLAILRRLYQGLGLDEPMAETHALLFYAFLFGQSLIQLGEPAGGDPAACRARFALCGGVLLEQG